MTVRPFNKIQSDLIEAMAEALFFDSEMAIAPSQVAENLQMQFAMMDGNKPLQIGLLLDALYVILGGPLFLLAGPEARAQVLESRLQDAELDFLQDLARIRSIIYAGYYGHWVGETQADNSDNPVHAQIGFTLPAYRVRGPGEVAIRPAVRPALTHADFLGDESVPKRADVIVIGSGAGGAVAAANLAAQGHDVLIVEAGAHHPSDRITHEERRMTAKMFVDGGIQTSRDNDFVVFQARCVGGGPVINNGIVLRVDQAGLIHPDAPDVFDKWASIGAPVDRAAFTHAYEAVEKRLFVERADPKTGRNNGTHLLDGWRKYAANSGDPRDAASPATWFRKNYGPRQLDAECTYCGYCNTGCPYGRKTDMAHAYLLDARARGAHILPEAVACEIRWSRDRVGGKRVADGVDVRLRDGRRRTIDASVGVVVAAGTMASSRLLDHSGIEGTGEGISLNIACPVAALMPHEMRSWDEDQMTSYVDRGDFLIESHFQPPMAMASLLPGWFGEHATRMKNYSRLASAGVLFPADRRGRLVNGDLRFKLDLETEIPLVREALATLSRVHFANGALEVYPALARGPTLRPDMDIDAFFKDAIREADDLTLSSSHPHGGNAMNADPALGVVDLDCRVHGTTNVLVTDASVLPTCIRVNAQLTTMAMAQYATARGCVFQASA